MEGSNGSLNEEIRSGSGSISGCGSGLRNSPKIVASSPSICAGANNPLQRNSASPSIPKKITSKNHNNTVFPTSFPNNLAELQLFRVMQNASLLYYYDTLLEMGGDDVQQLCDAGEEEFLEIMSLVGMASKPLHVRRLQKSLQEWVTNPGKFKLPLVPGEDFEIELSSPRVTGGYYSFESSEFNRNVYSPSPGESLPPIQSPGLSINRRPYSPLETCPPSSSSSPGNNTLLVTPTLLESQIAKLANAAERLSKHLPQFEPKPHNTKKKMCKELELVMSMPETDPRRMDEIRRYAAIYGRFDCKRRPEKPLTLHEVSVNEAAAQICRFVPALLTRRDELFPLARQVVKDSGCHYSKVQYTPVYTTRSLNSEHFVEGERSSKRHKPDTDHDQDDQHNHKKQNKNQHLRSSSLATDDETDSHLSYSNSSSPCQPSGQDQDSCSVGSTTCQYFFQSTVEDQIEIEDTKPLSPKVQVIASSGDNIIAVANPALAMSTALMPLAIVNESRDGVNF
ncbi:NGFI-A-binding protein homolog isoform X2 [Onthophagus taurus]|uniref:NGFI-A-binding protein homolog isoform X2 n=1 Tax=Onthophagus taurus TaxID=166361 RepID=UPI0039BE2BF8